MKLCLNMIVKNEAAIIERCLTSIAPHISSYVICDTGSTDGTPELIWKCLKGIPGHLYEIPFDNFEQARNQALDYAYQSHGELGYDYLLLCDADMELRLKPGANLRDWDPKGLACFYLEQRLSTVGWWNIRLIRYGAKGRYEGFTHEFFNEPDNPRCKVDDVWFVDHADGSSHPEKLARDARLLSESLKQQPNNARNWYYLAATLRDAGKLPEAALAFATRVQLGGWGEEAWHARLERARCLYRMNDYTGFVFECLGAFEMRPWRAEPLHELVVFYRQTKQGTLEKLFENLRVAIPRPRDEVLFVEDWAYSPGPSNPNPAAEAA